MEEQVYQLFSKIQKTHWWFVARRIILEDILKQRLSMKSGLRIADIGCGTGALLPMLSQFGETWGVDDSPTAIELCRRENFSNVYLDDDPAWRRSQFDLMTFLDVIEHVDDDVSFLKNYLSQLKPGGLVVITVPALMLLWSDHDVLNHHRRRYTARQLRDVILEAGLVPERITYFNSLLFPIIALVRLAMRFKNHLQAHINRAHRQPAHTDFERNLSSLNGLLKVIFASERFFLRRLTFPLGTSVLCLARTARAVETSIPQRLQESGA